MQESEFTGSGNKVQGKALILRKNAERKGILLDLGKNFLAATLTLRAASCTMSWEGA
jgi:hypothetical protein